MADYKSSIIDWLVIGLPLAVLAFLYSPNLIDPVLLPKYLGWGIFLILFLLYLLIMRYKGFGEVLKRNYILWALAGYLLISAISLFYSRNLADGLFEWFKGFFLFSFILFTALFFQNSEAPYRKRFTLGILFLTYVLVAFGFYQFLNLSGTSEISHASSYAITGTFAHRNLFAEVLFLTLPFNLYGFWEMRGFLKWLCLLGAFLCLFIIIILMSRAVWLAVVAGGFTTMLAYVVIALWKGILGKTVKKNLRYIAGSMLAFFLVIAASVFVYSQFDTTSAFKKQALSIFQLNFDYGSIGERIDLWSKSYEIIKENPITGVGLGDWDQELLKRGNKGMLSADNKTFFQRPHNDYLWVWSESGILAFLFYIGMFGSAFYMLIRRIRNCNNGEESSFAYMQVFALTGYLTYAFFSFPKERIEHQILLGFILALVSLENNEKGKRKGFYTKADLGLIGLSLILIISGIFMGYKRFRAEAKTRLVLEARMSQNPRGVIRYIEKAETPFYRVDPMSTPLNWYSGSAYYKLGKYDKALRDFKIAYKHNPYHMHVVNNLGTLYKLKGESDSAIKYYKKALELSPEFTTASLNLAAVYYSQGNIKKALEALRNLPYTDKNTKYKKYLTTILRRRTKSIKQSIRNGKISHVIARMLLDDKWIRNIYKKSLEEENGYRRKLIKDAIYVLEEMDKSITFEKANKLRQKYL